MAGEIMPGGDTNEDGKLAREEFLSMAETWFVALDPDAVGRVGQVDFLQRFDGVLPPQGDGPPAIVRAGRSMGFFTVVDLNGDAALERGELVLRFEEWFDAWDADENEELDVTELAHGLDAVLPRTNMSGIAGRESQDPIPGLPTPPPSPVFSPAESMETIELVDGFRVELAASEPMIEDPVALSFDADGRAYVVEMRSFMLDIDRVDERAPIGRISRLVDTDGDGRFDESTIFVDGLILPRAVVAVDGGILYVSDYMLYFAEDTDGDGVADSNELVDAEYGGGNVEHAPNGLFPAMDNWIYNAKSSFRYRLVGDTWIKQETEFRGQWGMTQDNYGRLLYNVNNSQLLGDYAPPNTMGRNSNHPSTVGLNLFVATDQRVFPIRMNTAINRGYSPEVLSPEGMVYVFASSCSPVVYRGDNFPKEFVGNAFVCDPAVNLIKRNIVFDRDLSLSSAFAYDDREFLASTDERFRPSNLYNGPDGTLWVVDFYRGIVQYGQFMTDYLRRETLERGLEQGLHFGRIYRIVSTTKEPNRAPKLSSESSMQLIDRLSAANGWTRDTAQRLLIERGDRTVAPALIDLFDGGGDSLARIHALWTLEGLFFSVPDQTSDDGNMRLRFVEPSFKPAAINLPPGVLEACLSAIDDPDSKVQVAAIRVTEFLTAQYPDGQRALMKRLESSIDDMSNEVRFQAALSVGSLPKPEALPLLARIAASASEHLVIRDAVVSGLQNWELQFLQVLLADPEWSTQRPGRSALVQSLATAIVAEGESAKVDVLRTLAVGELPENAWRPKSILAGIEKGTAVGPTPLAVDARALTTTEVVLVAEGQKLYQQLCAGCHGLDGRGIKPMAPPLLQSDWVLGSEGRLIRIALQGMTGPVTVNGTGYQPPDILPEMPGLAVLDDAQIASVLSYIRRAWNHGATPVSPEQVAAVRDETREKQVPWTESQLRAVE